MNEKSLNDVVKALNTGELTMDQLLANLDTEVAYVRRGTSFAELKFENISQVNGKLAKVYSVASDRIERDGKIVERKPRKKAESNGA
jgi:hypothetical protein